MKHSGDILSGEALRATGNLFSEGDYVDESLVPKGSDAFTAAHIAPDGDFVEVFEQTRPVRGVHCYEFRGLGTDDVTLTTPNSLSNADDILAAVHLALQTSARLRRIEA